MIIRIFSATRLSANESNVIGMGELVLLLRQEKKARGFKRPRESRAIEALHGIGKWLFSYGINRHEGVASFWDAFDFDLAYVATLTEVVDQRFKFYDKELKRLEAALEEMKKEIAPCQEQLNEVTEGQAKLKDHYNREVTSGQSFLKSETGKIYLECIWNYFKEKYEDSEEFEGVVVARANDIYDQAIRQCRTKLSESGRFTGEDFTFLDPFVADEDVAEESEMEVVDEPPTEDISDAAYCKIFLTTLTEKAMTWFNQLPIGSIDNFEQLSQCFSHHFAINKRYPKTASYLFTVIQREHESLRDYVKRFFEAVLDVPHVNSELLTSIMQQNLRKGRFRESIAWKPPASLDELLVRAKKYIRIEETLGVRVVTP
ncbi:hypothetical protein Sango_1566100 [Sesamum angolense]|uniref:Retrotransposon gag domain-containing protein n=1 Tax=Sesamum angolense TaxID=2727404 RepID=A0AAE2BTR7_9LAMI|nr:hypothetical protein Sango_1566100 [Sesamum angolense]